MKTRENINKHFGLIRIDTIEDSDSNETLYRIYALKNSTHAKKGDLGGYVSKNTKLDDGAWVTYNAKVSGGSSLRKDVLVKDNARVHNSSIGFGSIVSGNANIENSLISKKSIVSDNAVATNSMFNAETHISGSSKITNSSLLTGKFEDVTIEKGIVLSTFGETMKNEEKYLEEVKEDMQKEGNKTDNRYEKVYSIVDPILKSYREDLEIHDKEMYEAYKNVPLITGARSSGTNTMPLSILPMLKGSSRQVFNDDGSINKDFIDSSMEWYQAFLINANNHFIYADNSDVRTISKEEANLILQNFRNFVVQQLEEVKRNPLNNDRTIGDDARVIMAFRALNENWKSEIKDKYSKEKQGEKIDAFDRSLYGLKSKYSLDNNLLDSIENCKDIASAESILVESFITKNGIESTYQNKVGGKMGIDITPIDTLPKSYKEIEQEKEKIKADIKMLHLALDREDLSPTRRNEIIKTISSKHTKINSLDDELSSEKRQQTRLLIEIANLFDKKIGKVEESEKFFLLDNDNKPLASGNTDEILLKLKKMEQSNSSEVLKNIKISVFCGEHSNEVKALFESIKAKCIIEAIRKEGINSKTSDGSNIENLKTIVVDLMKSEPQVVAIKENGSNYKTIKSTVGVIAVGEEMRELLGESEYKKITDMAKDEKSLIESRNKSGYYKSEERAFNRLESISLKYAGFDVTDSESEYKDISVLENYIKDKLKKMDAENGIPKIGEEPVKIMMRVSLKNKSEEELFIDLTVDISENPKHLDFKKDSLLSYMADTVNNGRKPFVTPDGRELSVELGTALENSIQKRNDQEEVVENQRPKRTQKEKVSHTPTPKMKP